MRVVDEAGNIECYILSFAHYVVGRVSYDWSGLCDGPSNQELTKQRVVAVKRS